MDIEGRTPGRSILLALLILAAGLVVSGWWAQRAELAPRGREHGLADETARPAPHAQSETLPVAHPQGTFWLDLPGELRAGEVYQVPVLAEAGDLWLYSYVIAFAWDPAVLGLTDVAGAPEYRIPYSGEDLADGEGQFGFLRLNATDESPDPLGRVHVATLEIEVLREPDGGQTQLGQSVHARSWFIACPDHDCTEVTDDDARLLDEANRHDARLATHTLRILAARPGEEE